MYRGFSFMGYRISGSKCLVTCLFLSFIMGCYLASLPIQNEEKVEPSIPDHDTSHPNLQSVKKRLAIIVPFRDRFEELLEFVPHMHTFLTKQKVLYDIFVIQQMDSNRFNRASLINVGFLNTMNDYDYIAMHDVDLLPLNDNLSYEYPADGPVHISSPQTHPKYHYDTFIGGILLITREHFKMVKGMSNNYWGWGLEDDEFYVRLKDAGLKVTRPSNITTGTTDTFKHIHDKKYRKRDMQKCFNQREVTRRRDRHTGLHDVKYKLLSTHQLTIDAILFSVLTVELICDKNTTPWCRCPETKPQAMPKK